MYECNAHYTFALFIHVLNFTYMYSALAYFVQCTVCVSTRRPPSKMHLCVSDFSVLPGQSEAELFDVVVIIKSNSQVARSAYPSARGSCDNKSSSNFYKCSLNFTSDTKSPF